MKFLKLSHIQLNEIDSAMKAHKFTSQYFNRLLSIKLNNKGYGLPEIASILDVHWNSVYSWICKYEKNGLKELLDKPKSGRPKILSQSDINKVKKIIEIEPRQLKFVLAKIQIKLGKSLSLDTLKRDLKSAGLTFRRVRKSLKSKQNQKEFALKKEQLKVLKEKEDKGKIDLYYYDESSFSLVPYIPYAWQKKNETIKLPSSKSKNIHVLGFLKRDNAFVPYVFKDNVDSNLVIQVFNDFIDKLNSKRKSVIVIDNAPTHTSNAFKET